MNPQIYPAWWGEDDDFDKAEQQRNKSRKAKEDSLDKRLRDAKKPKQVYTEESSFADDYHHKQLVDKKRQSKQTDKTRNVRQDSSPSYAYTSNKSVPKYSPMRNPVPGANNIPMSYAGPPTEAEMNRNRGRKHHNNTYDRREDTYNDDPMNRSREIGGGGMAKGGGMIISYSPPRNRDKDSKAKPKGKGTSSNAYPKETKGRRAPA